MDHDVISKTCIEMCIEFVQKENSKDEKLIKGFVNGFMQANHYSEVYGSFIEKVINIINKEDDIKKLGDTVELCKLIMLSRIITWPHKYNIIWELKYSIETLIKKLGVKFNWKDPGINMEHTVQHFVNAITMVLNEVLN